MSKNSGKVIERNRDIEEAKRHLALADRAMVEMHEELLLVRGMQADITGSLGRLERAYHKMAEPDDV